MTAREAMLAALAKSGFNQTELAQRMGATTSFVSKLLGPSQNMSLKTLARVIEACGYELVIDFKERER